jgi:addiction module HigA family antidote
MSQGRRGLDELLADLNEAVEAAAELVAIGKERWDNERPLRLAGEAVAGRIGDVATKLPARASTASDSINNGESASDGRLRVPRTLRSSTTTEGGTMNDPSIMSPIHPGEILLQEYLEPLAVTQHRLAVAIGVPPRRINEIVHGKRRISADTALRLARYFGTSERFWLNLQSRHDIESERDRLAHTLEEIQPLATT